jgi:protein TonB
MATLTSASATFSSFDIDNTPALPYKTGANTKQFGTRDNLRPRQGIDNTISTGRSIWALAGLALLLHGAAVVGYLNYPETTTAPQPKFNKVEIEFIKPTPPEVAEPPKPPPPPPPPKVIKQAPPPVAKPAPALRTAVAQADVIPDAITVPENREAPVTNAPVVAAAPAPEAPPPAKVEEPVTEATGNAAYLNNPPPEYPAFAQRQGWEGKVLLRVHVLASGKPDKVEIKQSSGRKTLDESALTAVRNWTFIPSKRGNTAIDGWATVPIEFKLAK